MGKAVPTRKPGPEDDLQRECFVIMPFGEKTFDGTKLDFDRVYREIIKPAVEVLNRENLRIRCVRCDEIEKAGMIHEAMIRHINQAEVAVVDITSLNPNVFYELGVRHTLHDRVTVMIRRQGTKNPFNIAGMNTVSYGLDKRAAEQARTAITNFVRNGLLSSGRDSLVHAMIPGLKVHSGSAVLCDYRVYRYVPERAHGKELCLVTGDIRYVNLNPEVQEGKIDIWVNSENINMEMARVFDTGVSALIRYLGAKTNPTGGIVEDTIADELRETMKQNGTQQVNPGVVVATGSGRLAETHGVRRIYHAASVYGTIGGGYHPIANVEHCVTAALQLADEEARQLPEGERYSSILFPVLGTGQGGADMLLSARRQFAAAITFLRGVPETPIRRVCFLARTRQQLNACRLVLAEMGVPRGNGEEPAEPPRPKRPREPRKRRA